MKRTISFVLAIVMLLSVWGYIPWIDLPIVVSAKATGVIESTDPSYFSFDYMHDTTTGEHFFGIMRFHGGVSDVVIPSEYMGEPVRGFFCTAFMNNKEITSVVMPETIKYLPDGVFSGCSNLESVTISGNVSCDAFNQCTKLTDVTFLPTVQEIGENAFSLTSIKDLVIPEGVKRIGRESFAAINTLETIHLPASLEYIDETAFEFDDNINLIAFMGTREQWQNNNGSKLMEYMYDYYPYLDFGMHFGTDEHVMVDDYSFEPTCTELGEKRRKCKYCSYSKTEYFPALGHSMSGWDTVRRATCTTPGIKENYCLECDYYESEEIPVVRHSFLNGKCKSCGVDIIEFEYNEEYGYAKVVQYNGYGDVIIPDESEGYPVTTLWNQIFTCPESITSITLGKNIDFLSPSMYEGCVALENLFVVEGNEFFKSVDGIWFSQDGKTLVKYPCGRKTESYTIPNEVNCLDDFAFAYNESLKSVKIHNGVTEIKLDAFAYCTSLESIKIPDGVKTMGASCFYGCTNLESVEIGNGVEAIGGYTFCECENIKNITLGTGIKRLKNLAFADCTGITHIELPYGLEEIGAYAFENCTNLVSITLPVTVTLVSSSAFSHSGLAFIFYKGTKEQFDAIGCGTAGSKVHYETDYHIFEDNLCNFCSMKEFEFTWTVTTVDITKYNGRSEVVTVPERLSNRDVVSISEGAFACVEGIVVPESVKLIDVGAINSDALIYCYENSYAQTFAEENGYVYETIAVHSVDENTHVDYYNKLVISSGQSCDDLETVVVTSADYDLFVDGKPVAESTAYYGTGSVIDVYDEGTLVDSFTMVIEGDTNGDSACDALDATQVALASNGNGALNGVYKLAADSDLDNQVDVDDYQAIVNKALSL